MDFKRLIAFTGAVGLTACSSLPSLPELPSLPDLPSLPSFSIAGEGVEERPAISCDAATRLNLQAMDWPGAKSVDVYIRKERFTPSSLVLKANIPNVIRLFNSDDAVRIFRAEEFFRSAAVVGIVYDGEKVSETCINAIRLGPRKWAEIRIVPFRQGEFHFGEEPPSPAWYSGPFPSQSQTGRIIVR